MSREEDNKALMRRFHEELNKLNLGIVDKLLADDYREHNPSIGEQPLDKSTAKQLFEMIYTAFPDLHRTVERQLAEGDNVVDHITYRGTHNGDFMGVPASGKQAETTAILITRIADGKIAEIWGLIDMMRLMQQVGAIPAPGG